MIGRVIDELARRDEWTALDRLIEAQCWCIDNYLNSRGERCFIGHIADYYDAERDGRAPRLERLADVLTHSKTEGHFDDLVKRFGMDRVVRAIKQRAGSHTRLNIEAPVTSESAVTHA